ncbi:MAG: sugar ABC transporter ATP-binding protein [Chloroflexia bacterium]|nr:sugar ABC transporter ATP-binding protein [Chloroflexia bacterium]
MSVSSQPAETSPRNANERPVLTMRGITKTFPGVTALASVDLDAWPGEVHALVGENGAGKSTLMKVLAGVYQPDQGEVRLDGERVRFHHPREAQERGVSIIHQEFNLLPARTVAQNIFLGREPRRAGLVDQRAMERATAEILARLGVERSISPRALIDRLSIAQRQTVEIAKALSFDARILVMDEPTAALSPHEVEALFARVRALQKRGIALLYVSHRLEEVIAITQRVTVLKDGERVDTVPTAETTPDRLIAMMVGRDLDHYYPERSERTGVPMLEIRSGGNDRLRDIDLTVHRGEIVGIGGLEGAGRTELARAIFGVEPFTHGTMTLASRPVRITSPRQAIRAGIGFLTEDRKGEGLVLIQTIRDNALLAFRSARRTTRLRQALGDEARKVDLRAASLDQEVRLLSGGNQQKVVLMKWLSTRAELLIFDEPTRGIDIGAKAGIYDLMRELAGNGAAILMISSELPEVIGLSDRIVVMRDGAIAGELPGGSDEATIMTLATGERDALVAGSAA